jgi:hypothetical protein
MGENDLKKEGDEDKNKNLQKVPYIKLVSIDKS